MRIELFGTAFNIQTDEDPAYLREIVRYYEDKSREISASVATPDALKISILTGLLLVDEVMKARRNQVDDEAEGRLDRLIATIDDVLDAPD